MHFSTCRPGITFGNFQTISDVSLRNYVGETYTQTDTHTHTHTPNLVEIGWQVAPPHSGEMSQFCDFCSSFFSLIFFCFLISPTGRNSGPIRTLCGWNDVFCLVHVPFQGLEPSNSLLGISDPKNTNITTRFLDFCRLCNKNCFSIRALERWTSWICRHLEFRKTVAISLLFGQFLPNLVGMLRIWWRTQLSCRKTHIHRKSRW